MYKKKRRSFFFSSRRRHTRWPRDWSSDVCSSDLSAESGSAAPDVHLRALAEELTRGLGTRVRIARRGRGGAIEIEFYSDAELNRLVDRLRMAATSAAAML